MKSISSFDFVPTFLFCLLGNMNKSGVHDF